MPGVVWDIRGEDAIRARGPRAVRLLATREAVRGDKRFGRGKNLAVVRINRRRSSVGKERGGGRAEVSKSRGKR